LCKFKVQLHICTKSSIEPGDTVFARVDILIVDACSQ
jgi:hypothetical protein